MKEFNPQNWSVRQSIIDRVQKEDNYRWAANNDLLLKERNNYWQELVENFKKSKIIKKAK